MIGGADAAGTTAASLSDVKHIVILMQGNRSFDHYFGTLSGTRGFSDPNVLKNANGTPIFDQYGFQPGTGPSAAGYLQPFHLLNDPPANVDRLQPHRGRGGGAQRAHRHARRGHPLSAPDEQCDAGAGGRPGAAAGPVAQVAGGKRHSPAMP
ncbi:hypothetical protein EAS64_23785 [Trebonia kvetii]|uniref:Phosphoesterase n=1 Tax=Trebonia kvetii TaxID=2480626 RepID=A0A6P2BYX8_9ACTN|nr:alkaline phosphatase family protein [Trebonia kvetii]TVZ03421.1 hypothetical protein EAS64_23785 [Trebonia kvetii]